MIAAGPVAAIRQASTGPAATMHPHPPHSSFDPAPTPPPGPTRTGRGRRLVRGSLLMVVALLLAAAAVVAWEVRRFAAIPRVEVAAVEPAEGGVANWLLVGTDSRDGIDPDDPNAGAFLAEVVEGARTDTILVARADPGARRVDLLSIPRDLWVPIAGQGGQGRINGAYNTGPAGGADGGAGGGSQRLAATVESALGIEVNHYLEVDFAGFRDVVDALGGVTVDFEHPTRDERSGLFVDRAGEWRLDGDQALALARSRTYEQLIEGSWRVDPTGDLGRTERQRALLAQIVEAAGQSVGPSGLLTADRVLAAGADSVILDTETDLSAVLSLVRTTAAVGADGVTSHALPVVDHRTSGGAQVLLLWEGEADEVLDRFRPGGS